MSAVERVEIAFAKFCEDIERWQPILELSANTGTLSTVHHPFGSPSGPGLWHVKGMQLPAYIQNIAQAIHRHGADVSHAIAVAVATVKRWASGVGNVSAEVRAASQKALAEWEAERARAHAT